MFYADVFSSAIFEVSIRNITQFLPFLQRQEENINMGQFSWTYCFFKCFPAVIDVIRQLETVVTVIKHILLVLELLQILLKASLLVIRRLISFLIFPLISIQTCSHPPQLFWDIETGSGPTSRPSTVCHCLCWLRSRSSIMPSLDHGEDSLSHSIQWLGKLVILIAEYACVILITTATKASSTFTKFHFSGFCPNEALEKQRHWRVKHSTEANVATGECESGAYKQDWLAEGAAGVADWWVRCRQRWGDGKERVYTGVDCQQAEWQV